MITRSSDITMLPGYSSEKLLGVASRYPNHFIPAYSLCLGNEVTWYVNIRRNISTLQQQNITKMSWICIYTNKNTIYAFIT